MTLGQAGVNDINVLLTYSILINLLHYFPTFDVAPIIQDKGKFLIDLFGYC
jgi:hypothetical protein